MRNKKAPRETRTAEERLSHLLTTGMVNTYKRYFDAMTRLRLAKAPKMPKESLDALDQELRALQRAGWLTDDDFKKIDKEITLAVQKNHQYMRASAAQFVYRAKRRGPRKQYPINFLVLSLAEILATIKNSRPKNWRTLIADFLNELDITRSRGGRRLKAAEQFYADDVKDILKRMRNPKERNELWMFLVVCHACDPPSFQEKGVRRMVPDLIAFPWIKDVEPIFRHIEEINLAPLPQELTGG